MTQLERTAQTGLFTALYNILCIKNYFLTQNHIDDRPNCWCADWY